MQNAPVYQQQALLGEAKIASNSNAIAKVFNAEIANFGCKVANHALISTSIS